MKTFFNKLHYSKNTGTSLFMLPVSFFYRIIINLRNFLYDINFLKSIKLHATVISVGNITTGGTGKTPVVSAIANHLTRQGKKVAVISRGYGGKLSNKNTNIISDGEKILYNVQLAGDEPFWIAKNSPKTIVITGKNRIKSGKLAIEKFKAEILILDDGFQHRKLHRDIDIALIDSDKLFGNGSLLPAGPLREPIGQLRRATKIIMSDKIKKSFVCSFAGENIEGITRAVAFSGIAQPDSFFNLLKEQNIEVLIKKVFSDHYLYTINDIQKLIAEAQSAGAQALITTEKDMVKLEGFMSEIEPNIPIYALKLKVNFDVEGLLAL